MNKLKNKETKQMTDEGTFELLTDSDTFEFIKISYLATLFPIRQTCFGYTSGRQITLCQLWPSGGH